MAQSALATERCKTGQRRQAGFSIFYVLRSVLNYCLEEEGAYSAHNVRQASGYRYDLLPTWSQLAQIGKDSRVSFRNALRASTLCSLLETVFQGVLVTETCSPCLLQVFLVWSERPLRGQRPGRRALELRVSAAVHRLLRGGDRPPAARTGF